MVVDSVEALFAQARYRGITLWIDAGRLCFRGPAGAMTEELRGRFGTLKAEVMRALQGSPSIGKLSQRGPVLRPHGPQQRLPIVEHHRVRWDMIKSGGLGIEYLNSTNAVVRLTGRLNIPALEASALQLTQRHRILTATVLETTGRPEFLFPAEYTRPLQVLDASHGDAAQLERMAGELIWRPFAHGDPWFRVFVISSHAGGEHLIGFVIHHFIADGWSVGIVARELSQAYAAFDTGRTPQFEELPIQYSDYVLGINEWLRSGDARQSAAYWHENLRGAPPTGIPADHEPALDSTAPLATRSSHLDSAIVATLRQWSRSRGILLSASISSALAVCFAHFSAATQGVILMRTSGRSDPSLGGVVGSFFDTVALRITTSMAASFASHAGRVHATLIEAYAHQDYPFQLVKSGLPEINASDVAPLLNFVDHELAPDIQAPSNMTASRSPPRPPAMHAARTRPGLYIIVTIDRGGLEAMVEYLELWYEPATAQTFVDTFCHLLKRAMREPDASLESLLVSA